MNTTQLPNSITSTPGVETISDISSLKEYILESCSYLGSPDTLRYQSFEHLLHTEYPDFASLFHSLPQVHILERMFFGLWRDNFFIGNNAYTTGYDEITNRYALYHGDMNQSEPSEQSVLSFTESDILDDTDFMTLFKNKIRNEFLGLIHPEDGVLYIQPPRENILTTLFETPISNTPQRDVEVSDIVFSLPGNTKRGNTQANNKIHSILKNLGLTRLGDVFDRLEDSQFAAQISQYLSYIKGQLYSHGFDVVEYAVSEIESIDFTPPEKATNGALNTAIYKALEQADIYTEHGLQNAIDLSSLETFDGLSEKTVKMIRDTMARRARQAQIIPETKQGVDILFELPSEV